jgi:hypothetical protein
MAQPVNEGRPSTNAMISAGHRRALLLSVVSLKAGEHARADQSRTWPAVVATSSSLTALVVEGEQVCRPG